MKNIFELTETDKIVLEYKDIIENIEKLEILLNDLGYKEYKSNEFINLETKLNNGQEEYAQRPKFKFLDSIFKRKKILYYENLKKEIEQISLELKTLKEKDDLEKKPKFEEIKNKIEIYKKRLQEIESIVNGLSNDKLQEFLIKLKEEVIYDSDGIPVIDDVVPENFEKNFVDLNFNPKTFSLDDIVMVHATDYFPENHIIKTSRSANAIYEKDKKEIKIVGESKIGNTYSHRNTIHFALNGKVSNHGWNSWDNVKFIIIEPMKYHMDTIHCVRPEDTWVKGEMKLSNESIILVREDVYDKLNKETLKDYNIIKFRGNDTIVVEKVLLMLGYKPKTIGMYNWNNFFDNDGDTKLLFDYIKKYYPDIIFHTHAATEEKEIEKNLNVRDTVISAIRDLVVDTKNGLNITFREFNILYEYFKRENRNDTFSFLENFIYRYGIRVKNNQFYLLDDDSILDSYKNGFDSEIVNEVENAITFHKVFKPLLKERRENLANIFGNSVDTKNNINLTLEMIFDMYYYYCKNNIYKCSVKDFINSYGIRKYDNDYIMLNDLEMINKYNNIDNNCVKELKKLIYNNRELMTKIRKTRVIYYYDDNEYDYKSIY